MGKLPHYYFPPKPLDSLDQERRERVNTIVMEQFNRIIFQNFGPANKQHAYQSINQSINQSIKQSITR
jgi:hypothetical protein